MPVHDPQVLRAIAHPVRNRILDELEAQGPLRAADVARELGIPANLASFHLRQLAKYGLVEEDPAAGRDRRDRVWRAVESDLTINLGQLESAPGGKAATAVFRRNAAAWGHAVVDHALAPPKDARAHSTVVQRALRLTAEEAKELAGEVGDLLESWAARTQQAGEAGTSERRTYLYYAALLPHPGLPQDAE